MRNLLLLLAVLLPALAFAGSDWELIQTGKGGVDIYKRKLPADKEPEIKGVGDLPGTPDKALALITDVDRYSKLLPHLKTAEVLKSTSNESFVYFNFDLPWPISDRDYVVRYQWKKVGDGYIVNWSDANYWRP